MEWEMCQESMCWGVKEGELGRKERCELAVHRLVAR